MDDGLFILSIKYMLKMLDSSDASEAVLTMDT